MYDHASNADLRKARSNPNVLYPGDVINIPDPTPAKFTRATGAVHRFVIKR